MRYGVLISARGAVADVVAEVRALKESGVDAVATSQVFGYDALTLLAVVGAQVPDIELMTAVVPTYPRHPIMLAGQALTTQAAAGGGRRLTLGIGLSHQGVIERIYGLSFERPARHMRDYLHVLMPLLHGDAVKYRGETIKVEAGPMDVVAPPPDVLVAALAPAMLQLAGALSDGTATWVTGPKTIAEHIVPSITAAATAAGRPPPRISVGLPVCVTADVDAARERAAQTFSIYGRLPVYRAVLDREGVEGPGDVALVGDEEAVATRIAALGDIGATDFLAAPFGAQEEIGRTKAFLAELARTAKA